MNIISRTINKLLVQTVSFLLRHFCIKIPYHGVELTAKSFDL